MSASRTIALSAGHGQRLLYHQRRWVSLGAATLAAVAGYTDTVMLRLTRTPVSHLSGLTARATVDEAMGRATDLHLAVGVIAAFMSGAACAGALIGTSQVVPGRRYSVVLWLEGVLLCLASVLLVHGSRWALPAGAFACGLQNGMANGFYGTVIRTTHLSGILTDIGVLLGHAVRRHRITTWRLVLLGGIVCGFVVGGVTGALAADRRGGAALLAPAVACLAGGTAYFLWLTRDRASRRAGRGGRPRRVDSSGAAA
ncbi:MAG TPA: YoaK family protein [Gemmatimonadaceae bacterium]